MVYKSENRLKVRDLGEFCLHLKEIGFSPDTIIDVGVASYTQGIYSFNDAEFFLFEPLEEYQEKAKKLLTDKKGSLYQLALSNKSGKCEMLVSPGHEDSAAITESAVVNHSLVRSISMKRLDEVIPQDKIGTNSILKVDVQGHDYFVLEGAGDLLGMIDIVIFEFMHFGKVSFADYVHLMNRFDLSLYEILSPLRRPYDDAVSQTDFVFVRENSFLRQHKRYR